MRQRKRWEYTQECWKHARYHWAALVVAVLVAAYSAIVNWGPILRLPRWAQPENWPKLPISWALVFVLSALCFILLEGGIRFHHEIAEQLEQAMSKPEGPEVWLVFVGQHIDYRNLGIKNINGGTARNVWLDQMTDGMYVSERSAIIPLLEVNDWCTVEPTVHLADKDLDGMTCKLEAFLSNLEHPITATVYHEDANGKRFVTTFSVASENRGYKITFEQKSRRLFH